MNTQVSVPCTEWLGSWLHRYPWKSLPSSLFIANSHLGPAVDCLSSLYSAKAPVLGLIAVAHLLAVLSQLLRLMPPCSAGTPRGGALVLALAFGSVCGCCCIVSKNLMSWVLWFVSNVLAKVSVGGLCRTTIASSTAALRRSKLSSLGNALVGNHISWLTTRTWRVCVAHTV